MSDVSDVSRRWKLRGRDQLAIAWLGMAIAAAASECIRAWPSGATGAALALLVVTQSLVLSAIWTIPLALLFAGGAWAWQRARGLPLAAEPAEPAQPAAAGRAQAGRMAALVWVAPIGYLQVTAGTALLAWSARAFVRQDLAAAVMPPALLGAFAALAAVGWIAHRLTRRWVSRQPRWAVVAAATGGAVAASVAHLARFSSVLEDQAFPVSMQLVLVAALGAGLSWWLSVWSGLSMPTAPLSRWARRAPKVLGAGAAVMAALAAVVVFGGRIAPLSNPVASAGLQARGLMAARIGRALSRAVDRDGDGVSAWFGGADCDDGDARVGPLAAEVPGNGVDEDCFDGDLPAAAVAADRRAREALRRPVAQRARSVVLITVDALRADSVGWSGGGGRSATPELDRLAADSAVFTSAWTQAPMTRKAFPALLAGRYPSNVHWLDLRDGSMYPVAHAGNRFMAEVVRDAGIDTAMVVGFSYPVLGRFNQGFRLEKVHPASRFKDEINANVVVDDGIRALEGWARSPERSPAGGEAARFFLWMHFYEAHYPYVAHKRFPGAGSDERGRYASEVRFVDHQIGRFLRRLGELGLADETAIVFTSDHGEEFGEHGGKWHGDLYPEDLHVPLVVHVPGTAARRIDAPARLIDVAPTVVDILGLSPPADFDGDSLLPWVDGVRPDPRLVFAELIPDAKVPRRLVAAMNGGWLIIADLALGSREVYDLARDPRAQTNVFVEEPERARELEIALRRHMELRIGPRRLSVAPGAGRKR